MQWQKSKLSVKLQAFRRKDGAMLLIRDGIVYRVTENKNGYNLYIFTGREFVLALSNLPTMDDVENLLRSIKDA